MGSSGSTPIDMNSKEAQFVKSKIEDNCVVVFSKSSCPYCVMAKQTLDSVGAQYEIVELNQLNNSGIIQDILYEMTGARTVPRVFIKGKCIGGGSETKDLHKQGKLVPMLQDCGVLQAK